MAYARTALFKAEQARDRALTAKQPATKILGRASVDEVRGAEERTREAYLKYGERGRDTGNEEIHHNRASYCKVLHLAREGR